MTWAVGIDVGGTFTDAVAIGDGGRAWREKAPTTPDDLTDGVLDALRRVADAAGRPLAEMLAATRRFGLGTTAVTNVLASRRGRTVGLLTTAGFEDLLPFARGRLVVEDGWLAPPEPLVSRDRIIGIDERIDRRGQVLRPLATEEVVAAGRQLVEAGAEALAVSFLWSCVEPSHELAAVEALATAVPDVSITAGSALHPVIREYERTMVAVLNAYAGGALTGVDRLVSVLSDLGLRAPVLLVHSGGGAIGLAEARRAPLTLVESGPAAGVAAAAALAMSAGVERVVTCDMGGTSVDVAVVCDGEPARRARGELMGFWTAVPTVDVESIGAGGGSIAWADARGMLQVGPHSAGARPGPACYGHGGTEPTVTDALVVLGYLDPQCFLGGKMRLDAGAASRACATLGERFELDGEETAWGIRQVALAGMVRMVRGRLAARGLDPATFSLLAFGGGGALFAADIASAVGIPRVLVPELASVLSATGAATIGVRRERLRSLSATLPIEPQLIEKVVAELAGQVETDLLADGIALAEHVIELEADLRFKRQTAELTVPLGADLAVPLGGDLDAAFRAEYASRYGEGALARGAPVELVTLRAVGRGPSLPSPFASIPTTGELPAAASVRGIRLDRRDSSRRPTACRSLDELATGERFAGPVVLDGRDTTVWVPPGATVARDDERMLVIEVGGG
ncbi:MAG: hypothetical protein JWO37_3732 [Acidimicrobiales bacterium]|jgi:N-methylhydantoinase A|nr:hypothetical protein [Acidimicrobiales bacterium]